MPYRGPSRPDPTEGTRQGSEFEGQAAQRQRGVNERGGDKACSQGTRIMWGCHVINEYTSTALCFLKKTPGWLIPLLLQREQETEIKPLQDRRSRKKRKNANYMLQTKVKGISISREFLLSSALRKITSAGYFADDGRLFFQKVGSVFNPLKTSEDTFHYQLAY